MDQEDPGKGHLDGDGAQRGQPVGLEEAEEVPEGEQEEDAGDGEDEGPGEVNSPSALTTITVASCSVLHAGLQPVSLMYCLCCVW